MLLAAFLLSKDYAMPDSNIIVTQARTWIGTPFHHQARLIAFEPGSIARNAGPRHLTETSPTLRAEMGDNRPAIMTEAAIRRLTPRECERLQGFPDDYTLIPYREKPAADGPRYKALGNSMHTGTMRWLGERIKKVEEIMTGGGYVTR